MYLERERNLKIYLKGKNVSIPLDQIMYDNVAFKFLVAHTEKNEMSKRDSSWLSTQIIKL